MQIFQLNNETIALGQKAFAAYRRVLFDVPSSSTLANYLKRPTGPRAIAGAIMAAITNGFTREEEICLAVSRATVSSAKTVRRVLNELTGDHQRGGLWKRSEAGDYCFEPLSARAPRRLAF
ncbi:hypothetical protein [uncultured Sphingomonas sp.]|uniref:hypothetical protein n=1 Tax=uncultured Sphingomonas sp. TaxID=158754 RepID=UPI0025E33E5B|nr:hypothetical protein [uncultured Sphingomonas sp.]